MTDKRGNKESNLGNAAGGGTNPPTTTDSQGLPNLPGHGANTTPASREDNRTAPDTGTVANPEHKG